MVLFTVLLRFFSNGFLGIDEVDEFLNKFHAHDAMMTDPGDSGKGRIRLRLRLEVVEHQEKRMEQNGRACHLMAHAENHIVVHGWSQHLGHVVIAGEVEILDSFVHDDPGPFI